MPPKTKTVLYRIQQYHTEIYKHPARENSDVLVVTESLKYDDFSILREEVEAGKELEECKAVGIDNIPAELIIHDGVLRNYNSLTLTFMNIFVYVRH